MATPVYLRAARAPPREGSAISAITASICPKVFDEESPDCGYRPAIAARLLDTLTIDVYPIGYGRRRELTYLVLYRIGAGLLLLGSLGHTLGGMLKTARRGPEAGPQADEVLSAMKSVHFTWRGADSTWFAFWLGNGLGVSALLLLAIVVLWVLGGLDLAGQRATLPIAWSAFISLASLGVLGLKYFPVRVGVAFTVIALLTGIAAVMSTAAVMTNQAR